MDSGYEIIPHVFDASSIQLERLGGLDAHRTRAGARHLMAFDEVRRIAADERLMDIARRFVGQAAVPFRATLFDKSPDSNWLVSWHQDRSLPIAEQAESPGWGPWSVKAGVTYAHAPATALERVVALRVSLDDSEKDNGPLRVLPGTHRRGVLTDPEIAALADDVQPVDCCVPAGGVIVMRPLAVHASSKAVSNRPRRVLHIEYAESLEIAPGMRLAIV